MVAYKKDRNVNRLPTSSVYYTAYTEATRQVPDVHSTSDARRIDTIYLVREAA